MWLATLGYRHSSQFSDKLFRTCPPSSAVVPSSQRGKSTPDAIVIDRESIRAHILRHSPSVSHHRRAHAPNVLYLAPELCLKVLWKDFLDTTNITCGYTVYRTECIKLHLSFAKLGQEECAKCVTLDGLAKKEHEQEAGRRRTTYEIEAANFKRLSRQPTVRCEEAVYTLDMQKVILLPRIDQYKECAFTRRLVCYNLTLVPAGSITKIHPAIAAIWHEDMAGRKGQEVGSEIMALLRSGKLPQTTSLKIYTGR